VLLDTIEARAAELVGTLAPDVSATLVVWAESETSGCRRALEGRGFAAARQYFEMRIDLGEKLETPRWPDGITPRSQRVGRDEPQLHAADTEAFAEHHLFEPRTYPEWRLHHVDRPDFDPALWPIGWDGDEIAGYAAASVAEDGGMVGDLAVRRPWRGRGLGRALLLEEFRALAERGVTVVRLFVDGQNATGAVQLYERAGMRIARRFDVFEKELTPLAR
jgi:mycothiol synthase